MTLFTQVEHRLLVINPFWSCADEDREVVDRSEGRDGCWAYYVPPIT